MILQGASHGKQTLRNPGPHRFIDGFGPQGHGDRRRLVGAGVIELAVDENRDGNQVGFAIGREFDQAQGTRSFVYFCATRRLSRPDARQNQSHTSQDDETPSGAV